MSYTIVECICGGEVKAYERFGGRCPECGRWVSLGTHNEDEERLAYEEEEERRNKERHDKLMELVRDAERRGTLTIRTYYEESDYDRTYRYSNIYHSLEELNGKFYHEVYFYDGDKKITVDEPEERYD